ncbi:hypothetical protein [Ekhidna sp.]|uniref:hypothetical protein n=1 Tax=Ekhidna sp. TaxID=2608089 RepID=UPI003512D920
MKFKSLASIAFLLLAFASNAQICKYVINDKDPLTDDIIRTVKTRLTGPTPYYYFFYIRNGSDYKFGVEVGDYGELENSIPKDSELIMRAGNGEVIRMSAIESASPQIITDFGTKITRYEVTYQMTEENMMAIAESGIVFIRIKDMKNSFSDQEIPAAVVQISKENAECIFK